MFGSVLSNNPQIPLFNGLLQVIEVGRVPQRIVDALLNLSVEGVLPRGELFDTPEFSRGTREVGAHRDELKRLTESFNQSGPFFDLNPEALDLVVHRDELRPPRPDLVQATVVVRRAHALTLRVARDLAGLGTQVQDDVENHVRFLRQTAELVLEPGEGFDQVEELFAVLLLLFGQHLREGRVEERSEGRHLDGA